MNKLIFIFLLVPFCLINAQELSNSGKSYLKFYEKSIVKLGKMDPGTMGYENEILQAEKHIDNLKKSDPAYDVSAMTAEVESYRTKIKGSVQQKKEDRAQNKDVSVKYQELIYRFFEGDKLVKSEADIPLLEQSRLKYEQELSTFLNSEVPKSKDANGLMKMAEDAWKFKSDDPTAIHNSLKFSQNSQYVLEAKINYHRMNFMNTRWFLLSKAFPKSNILSEAAKKSAKAFAQFGSEEAAAKKAEETRAAKLKDTKIKPPVINDASLENEIKGALLKSTYAKGGTVLKVSIQSSDWQVILRNEITGVIKHRSRFFEATLQDAGGKCFLISTVWYQQDHDGSNYTKGYIYQGEVREMMCENAK